MAGNIGTVVGFLKKMVNTPLYYTINKYTVCNELRYGTLVGTDDKGNEYYENNTYFLGRNRWIQFSHPNWLMLKSDASEIPPEWHSWMHYMTDETPITLPPTERKFHMEHRSNKTRTFEERYTPCSTTKPKIEAWNPNQDKQLA